LSHHRVDVGYTKNRLDRLDRQADRQIDYKPVQHVTVLNSVGNCNTMVSIKYNHIILHYYVTILWDHRRICGPSLTETSLCGAYLKTEE